MRILVIGSGGREHAIAWSLAQSRLTTQIYVAPGNGGTQLEPKVSNINLTSVEQMIEFASTNNIDYTVVGPEAWLMQGIVDKFGARNLQIFGPTQACARLETSKAFAKDFMLKHNIPTAKFVVCTSKEEALQKINNFEYPLVIKADGLAAGKGVFIVPNPSEATTILEQIFDDRRFGEAGLKVVIEEFIDGIEVSFIVMCDGKNIIPLSTSQDHKRLLDNDKGPNTGGMGAYSPAPMVDQLLFNNIMQNVIIKTIDGLKNDGLSYTGFLYAGLMIKEHQVYVLEYNCRLGDPETQPLLYRIDYAHTDFAVAISKAVSGDLKNSDLVWHDNKVTLSVVLCGEQYPTKSCVNKTINGIKAAEENDSRVKVFRSGTKIDDNANCITNGGRVLSVTTIADNIYDARQLAYNAINNHINFNGMQYRSDIGNKVIQYQYTSKN